MAIQYGAYGQGRSMPTVADEYAGQAAMLPDLGAEFEKGEERVRNLELQRQADEKYEMDMIKSQLDYDIRKDAFDQVLKGEEDLGEEALELLNGATVDGGADSDASVNEEAAAITGQESNGAKLPPGFNTWSRERKASYVNSLRMSRSNIANGTQAATELLQADPPIDLTVPNNKKAFDIATALQNGRVKRGNRNSIVTRGGNTVDTYDLIVTTPDGEITIPNGDFSSFLNTKDGSSISTIENKLKTLPFFKNLNTPGKMVNETLLNGVEGDFKNLFQGDSSMSLESFKKYAMTENNGQIVDGDGDANNFSVEDAWATFKFIQEQGATSMNRWGKTTNQIKLENERKKLLTPTPAKKTPVITLGQQDAIINDDGSIDYQSLPVLTGNGTVTPVLDENDKPTGGYMFTYKDGKTEKDIQLTGDPSKDKIILSTAFGNFEKDRRNYIPRNKWTVNNIDKLPQSQINEMSDKDKTFYKYLKIKADIKKEKEAEAAKVKETEKTRNQNKETRTNEKLNIDETLEKGNPNYYLNRGAVIENGKLVDTGNMNSYEASRVRRVLDMTKEDLDRIEKLIDRIPNLEIDWENGVIKGDKFFGTSYNYGSLGQGDKEDIQDYIMYKKFLK